MKSFAIDVNGPGFKFPIGTFGKNYSNGRTFQGLSRSFQGVDDDNIAQHAYEA